MRDAARARFHVQYGSARLASTRFVAHLPKGNIAATVAAYGVAISGRTPEGTLAEQLHDQFINLRSFLEKKFDSVGTGLDHFDARVTGIDGLLAGLEQRVTAFEKKFTAFEQEFTAFQRRFSTFEQAFITFDRRFTAFELRFTQFEHGFAAFEQKFAAFERRFVYFTEEFNRWRR